MRVWRLIAERHAATALTGEGASRFGGRWNPVGTRMVYTADSLALATLELSVHLLGARASYLAIQFEIPTRSIEQLGLDRLPGPWRTGEPATQALGDSWVTDARTLALSVPSALVDARSGERNVLINPLHPELDQITELQRFTVDLDERL